MNEKLTELLKRRSFVVLFLLLFLTQTALAQQSVSGTVSDNSGTPLPGANVVVKGTAIGTQTDFDGRYTISANAGATLVFSYIGFATQELAVGDNLQIDITLVEDSNKLDEVVVIGYGAVKKKDLTGAVASISTDSYENQPLVRVEDALQGRAAGVTVARGGSPGAGIKVRVRGVNSVTGNNDPLVVVDGVFGGDLRTINPNDIASIEVLKDASALAIYGSRGSNGVILVTTKRGSGKAKVSFEHFMTINERATSIDRISSADFARQKNEQLIGVGSPAFYSDAQISDFEANPIDYQDLLFQTGVGSNTQLSVSGSDDRFRYFVSGNYVDQEGTIITTEYERFSLRSNVNMTVSDKLNVGVNLYASRETEVNNPDNFNRFKGSVILKSLTWDPTLPVQDEDGNFITTSNFANNGFNPIGTLLRSNRERLADRFNANLDIGYNITEKFKYQLIVGAATINQNVESFIRDDNPNPGNPNHTRVTFINSKITSYQVSNILNWNNSYGKHNFDVTGVYEFQGARSLFNGYNTNNVNTLNFFLSDNENIANEDFFNNGAQSAIQSYLGRVQYNFDNSLYLTGSMRIDESSRFARGNRTGFFPSGAVAYSFNNAAFVKNSNFLSNLKLRAGWGKVGNENINASARFSLTNDAGRATFDGETVITGSTLVQQGNPDLTWETTTQTNIGLDLGLFNGRLNASIDYYNKTTEDLLLRTILPGTTIAQFQNVGEVENNGIDLSLSGTIVESDDFTWDATLTLSHLTNEITDLIDDQEQILGNINSVDGTENPLNIFQRGQPLGQFYGLTFLGTWKSDDTLPEGVQPGDPIFLTDDEGNLVFNAIGNGLPTLTWGFNSTFTYKNWVLNFFVNAAHDFDVFNQVRGAINGGTGDFRDDLSPLNAGQWTPQNETEIPRRSAPNLLFSSRYVEDGSFIRLSNLKLGYTFNNVIKGIGSLQLYASGQNLLLITDYSGYDPEVSSSPVQTAVNNVDAGVGIDIGAYPNPRTFALGIKADF